MKTLQRQKPQWLFILRREEARTGKAKRQPGRALQLRGVRALSPARRDTPFLSTQHRIASAFSVHTDTQRRKRADTRDTRDTSRERKPRERERERGRGRGRGRGIGRGRGRRER
eukprot:1457915-Rhodomonas_salina.1